MKTIRIWVQKDCQVCCTIIQKIKEDMPGIELVIKAGGSLVHDDDEIDATTQLLDQNMELPVIEVDGEFVKPNEFVSKVKELI